VLERDVLWNWEEDKGITTLRWWGPPTREMMRAVFMAGGVSSPIDLKLIDFPPDVKLARGRSEHLSRTELAGEIQQIKRARKITWNSVHLWSRRLSP
jgi:hypothetical protein